MRLRSRTTAAAAMLVTAFLVLLATTADGPTPGPALEVALADDGAPSCVGCHTVKTPGIISHWKGSAHAEHDVGCIECHEAEEGDLDGWVHEGQRIATVVTPKDCGKCHENEAKEFEASHHAKGGNILHSLDNLLAEVVEGHRGPVKVPNPHKPGQFIEVNGLAFANSGCHQCHGSQMAFLAKDGTSMVPWKLAQPAGGGKAIVTFDASLVDTSKLQRGKDGRPVYDSKTWPNTGIGRMNMDGSRGSCSACHSRHDFSSRRARQPENCGRCHLGPDHPQKEIYEESKHGIAYRDMKDQMNLSSKTWVLGKDYAAAPTCATCHMSATRTQPITHDPRKRISWNNRPPVSKRLDTDDHGKAVADASKATHTWQQKRAAMVDVCTNCHSPGYVDGFYKQYDDFVKLYNAKYGTPGSQLMSALKANGLISKSNFDDKVEWTWFYLWHHEGRRARHGASMMAPDYAHWHGTYEVADRWYNELVPEIREILEHASHDAAKKDGAAKVQALLDEILARPEHRYTAKGSAK